MLIRVTKAEARMIIIGFHYGIMSLEDLIEGHRNKYSGEVLKGSKRFVRRWTAQVKRMRSIEQRLRDQLNNAEIERRRKT